MKKIYSLLAIFLCVGLIAPVYGASIEQTHMDSLGRLVVQENGETTYFNQKVVVTDSELSYNFDYEVIDNCTVTIKTNGRVVIFDENGDRVVSKNGYEFRYTANCRFTFMTWNNFPYENTRRVDYVDTTLLQFVINSVCTGIDYTELPETIRYSTLSVKLTDPHVPGRDSYYYDYYWYSGDNEEYPMINIWGDGAVKPYDKFKSGCIYSESQGDLYFKKYDKFISALNEIDDAYGVEFSTRDSNDSNKRFDIAILLHE